MKSMCSFSLIIRIPMNLWETPVHVDAMWFTPHSFPHGLCPRHPGLDKMLSAQDLRFACQASRLANNMQIFFVAVVFRMLGRPPSCRSLSGCTYPSPGPCCLLPGLVLLGKQVSSHLGWHRRPGTWELVLL